MSKLAILTAGAYRETGAAQKQEKASCSNYCFVVLLAGRAPLVSLESNLVMTSTLADASQITAAVRGLGQQSLESSSTEHVLRLHNSRAWNARPRTVPAQAAVR
jgi:hypothetical protein